MSNLIPYLPLDLSGESPTNLVSNEEQPLLQVSGVAYPVVVMTNGGFYTRGLQVLDASFNVLTPNVDYIATYKHQDASNYTGLEICSTLVFLNTQLTGSVLITAQMVGGDLAFSLTAREDTLAYLRSIAPKAPIWTGYLGVEPQWEDGQLRHDRWSLKGIEPFVFSLEGIVRSLREGDPVAEDAFRQYALAKHDAFVASFVNKLTPHLQDKANPHQDVKADIGLDQVANYPVSTVAQAQKGTDNATYLTPKLFYNEADALGIPLLTAHQNDFNNPHQDTAAQLGIYTSAQVDQLAAQKLPVGGTAVNSNALAGLSWPQIYDTTRANLDASFFTGLVFAPERLGVGGYNSEYVLRGDGQWVAVASLFTQYAGNTGTKVYYVGQFTDYNSVLANVNASFVDINAYPIGTIIIWRYYYLVYIAYGNGVGKNYINPTRAIVRTASGWTHLTTDARQAI